jgi:NADPH-dependent 2,4-dienoyl-CoA reductase/sulfur reductase-like enzyme
MKILVIGAVAAGTSAAAKARRNDEQAEIKIFDMDSEISYSSCGLPYFIGTEVESRELLVPRDAKFFKKKYNVDVYTRHEVLEINAAEKFLSIKNLETEEIFKEAYDKLIIATGARSVRPGIEGINKPNVFSLRNVRSAENIRNFLINKKPKNAVIVGSGFIGLELVENFMARGINVTVVEMADHVMASLDKDIAVYLEDYLREQGVNLILNDFVTRLEGDASANKVVLKAERRSIRILSSCLSV